MDAPALFLRLVLDDHASLNQSAPVPLGQLERVRHSPVSGHLRVNRAQIR